MTRLIPDIALSEEAFTARHRVLRLLLWVHIPVILLVGFFNDQLSPGQHTPLLLGTLGAVMVCGVISGLAAGQRSRAISTSVGFLLAAAASCKPAAV